MQNTKTSKTAKIPKHLNVEITVKDFGPIADATINLHPLTVFVGPSNTGKPIFLPLSMHCTAFFTVSRYYQAYLDK